MAANQDPSRTFGLASRRSAFRLAGVIAAGGAAAAMSTGLPAASAQAEPAQIGPANTGRFSVEIDGVLVAGVQTVEGIESESEIVEYQEGGDAIEHFRPGNHKAGKITIAKDWSNTHEFYTWRKTVLDGKVERKSVSVIFFNDRGEASRLNFYQCWPSKWVGPSLNARSSAHATETIELVWETIAVK